MKSKRVPDRVHVVRPPENDDYGVSAGQNREIIRTLAKVGDKLKRSEAERYELLAEMREYRRSLRELEDKSESSEKAYLAVENKLNSAGILESDMSQRQIRFQKSLKETEDKMLKAIAGQAVIDQRLKDTEDRQTMIDERLDQSVEEQTKLGRQMELVHQDKALMLRKVEKLEEIVLETQNVLRGGNIRALLADQSKKQSDLSLPAWSNVQAETEAPEEVKAEPERKPAVTAKESDWFKYINLQSVSTAGLIVVALLLGWSINQMQSKPSAELLDTAIASSPPAMPEEAQQVSTFTDPQPDNVLDYSDDQLLEALNNDPEQLASQLNDIEPSAVKAWDNVQDNAASDLQLRPAITDPQITPEMENFEAIAFVQDPTVERAVRAEKSNVPLRQRIQSDSQLPRALNQTEAQAFRGNADAQHDLAAIYTAGYADAGVEQDFDRAAFWFREASDNGVANARYNLGVFYHQGLGQDRDLGRALYWYREAAKLDHAEAQYNLGIAHIEGIGTEYNPQLAAAYFERAANSGIMEAAYNLGLIHDNGLMGKSKPDEALLWYKVAADQGSAEAKAAMEQLAKTLQMSDTEVRSLVDRMQILNETAKGRRAGSVNTVKEQVATSQRETTRNRAPVQSTPRQQVKNSSLVTQVQEYLMLTGAYAGPADGISGPATRDAIRAYQAANGLNVDGRISEPLLNSMVGGAMERLGEGR